MDSLEYIKQKYLDLIPRSFKTKLDIYLFNRCIRNRSIGKFDLWEFMSFKLTKEIVVNFERAWQLGTDDRLKEGGLKMKEIDNLIETWLRDNEDLKTKLLKEYKTYFITDLFPFSKFENMYSRDPKERKCHYCNITDEEIEKLGDRSQINTKRERGYAMEIDRIKPNYEYTPKNVVLACYWCNNAKTDEFSEKEFCDHVGPGIGKVWNERTTKNT